MLCSEGSPLGLNNSKDLKLCEVAVPRSGFSPAQPPSALPQNTHLKNQTKSKVAICYENEALWQIPKPSYTKIPQLLLYSGIGSLLLI